MADTGTFNGTGADASGSDGDSNRILTIENTKLTSQEGFLVYASGLPLGLTTEYTVTHNSTGTQITFLNGLWDDMTVIVNYIQSIDSGMDEDFVAGPIGDFGVSVTRTPVTTTTGFSGQKTYSDGTPASITVVFSNPNTSYALDKSGLTKKYDAVVFVQSTQTINKRDKITHNSNVYRVADVSDRKFGSTTGYKVAGLFFVS